MKFTLLTLSMIFLSFSVYSEEYKAPKVKLKTVDQKQLNVSVQSGNLDSGLNYKVEDRPFNDRAVASDEEPAKKSKKGRDPSSKTLVEYEQDVKMWKFEDIEDHP